MVRPGYKQTEIGEIPEDWDVLTLPEVAIVEDGDRGSNYPSKKDMNDSGYCLFLNAGNVTKTGFKFDNCDFISKEKDSCLRNGKLCRDDIVLTTRGTVGNFSIFDELVDYDHIRINSGMVIIRNKAKNLHPAFLYSLLCSHIISSQVNTLTFGSAQPQLTVKGINTLKFSIPNSEDEQKAIAEALSDVDELIASLEILIAKKRDIKTATMQQLLTGKKRLPGFGEGKGYKQTELGQIPEDWDVKQLDSMLKLNPKYGINAPAVQLKGDLPVYIRITDISDEGYFSPKKKVGVDSLFSGQYFLEKGDLVFARTGASVGKSYLYNQEDGELVYAGFLIRIRPDESVMLSEYLFQYVKTKRYWDWVRVMSMRSGQPGINGNEYGQLVVPVPMLDEQLAITSFLSDMDKEITMLGRRLKKTKAIKQGMMQELLTGRTRLIKPHGAAAEEAKMQGT